MKKFVASLLLLGLASSAFGQSINGGGGGGGGSGSVTSIDTSCGISGGPITTTGTIQGSATPNAQTGTTYAIQNSDCGKLLTLSNSSGVAASIAQAGGGGNFASGWFVTIINEGAGAVTITPTTSTIDGGTSLKLSQYQSVDVFSDGSNYFTARGVDSTGSSHPAYIADAWYLTMPSGGQMQVAANVHGQNRILCYPAQYPIRVTLKGLGALVGAAGSTNAQFAIYTDVNGRPGTLIAATGNIANTAANTVITGSLTASKQVGPGGADGGRSIWHCSNVNDGTVTFFGSNNSNSALAAFTGSLTPSDLINSSNAGMNGGVSCSGANCNGGSSTFGTWPTLTGSTWTIEINNVTGNRLPVQMYQVVP